MEGTVILGSTNFETGYNENEIMVIAKLDSFLDLTWV